MSQVSLSGRVRACAAGLLTVALFGVIGPSLAFAQTPPPAASTPPVDAPADTTQSFAIKTFLDCRARGCDFDFLRDQVR